MYNVAGTILYYVFCHLIYDNIIYTHSPLPPHLPPHLPH